MKFQPSNVAVTESIIQSDDAVAQDRDRSAKKDPNSHLDPDQFLGMNWSRIGVTLFISALAAVAADVAVSYARERFRYRGKD